MSSREMINFMHEILRKDKTSGTYGFNRDDYEIIENFIQIVTAELYLRDADGKGIRER